MSTGEREVAVTDGGHGGAAPGPNPGSPAPGAPAAGDPAADPARDAPGRWDSGATVAQPGWPAGFGVPPRPRSKVVVKADLVPAISVLSTVSLGGLLIGWLWSRLAPPLKVIVGTNGAPIPLPVESYHRFDALAVFTVLCLCAGLVTAAGIWAVRERRGPVVLVAAVLGAAVGAWLAAQVGVSLAEGRFPVPSGLAVADQYQQAPRLESLWGVVGWPLFTALVYGILATWNGNDDLGRRLG